jgi:hypothetical protein
MSNARLLDLAAFDAVVAEAKSRDLPVSEGEKPSDQPWKYLHIAGRPCQVSRTNLAHTSAEYPNATSLPIYLPRTGFADFVIYVPMDSEREDFYIVPRGLISKDTCLTPESLNQYKNAWHLLGQASLDMMMRRKTRISWQLQSVILFADSRGLRFELIKTAKGKKLPNSFRTVHQRRIMIEGKKCAIFSATAVPIQGAKTYRVVVIKAPLDDWADFQIYLRRDGVSYVIPRGIIAKTTTLSLNSPLLRAYENAWNFVGTFKD